MLLSQEKALILLRKYRMDFPTTVITKDVRHSNIKFPVALKIDSPQIIHKSDLGLVFTNIKGYYELFEKKKTAVKILKKNNVEEYHFIIQEMVKGQEIIIGMNRDEIFGPVILFGLGGVFVEVLKDVSMRIAPLTKDDCLDMINEIKGKKLLDRFRNLPKVNKQKIIDLLLKTSDLSMNEKNIKEFDFNPVMVSNKAVVVDARFIAVDENA